MELSEFGVAAVTEGRILGMLAAAPGCRLGLNDVRFHGTKAGAFVGAVAERLAFGLTATAPVIGAGLGGLNIGTFACDDWFTHNHWI